MSWDEDDSNQEDGPKPYQGPAAKIDINAAIMEMSSDPDVVDFLEGCATGMPKYLAAASVGWSPAQIDRKLKDPSFRALYDGADDLALDGVELAMIQKARMGHVAAGTFVLTNRRPDRWAEKRQLEVKHNVGVNDADKESIKAGVIDMLKGPNRAANIAALQAKAIEAHSAEVDKTA